MAVWIFNSLTKEKELFVPVHPGEVRMYFCGPTVYADTHIGHLRPALTGDMVARWLRERQYQVRYVVNFTDIDDKIIQKAIEWNLDPLEVSEKFIGQYLNIMKRLGVDQVDEYPRVTEHIPEIIEMVEHLVDQGYAYPLDGDVYYSVESKEDYGKLSGRKLEDMMAGARVKVDERKRHPMDFALWKKAKTGEPSWPSPWGDGRPGWHIECSAMSMRYLGETFDIHGGGDDLIFPHHENEIAQSEAYSGKPFARYWIHNGMIQINNEKMSKSLGNFITAEAILERFPAPVIRLFLFTTHYRNPLNFSDQALEEARRGWERLCGGYRLVSDWETRLLEIRRQLSQNPLTHADQAASTAEAEARALSAQCELLKERFDLAMDDDFNTARALASLFDLVRESNSYIHRCLQNHRAEELSRWPRQALEQVSRTLASVRSFYERCESVLGVIGKPETTDRQAAVSQEGAVVDALIELLLEIRQQARAARNWQLADQVRDRLAAIGFTIEDTPQGPRWKRGRS